MANPICVKTVENQTQTTSTLAKNKNVKSAIIKERPKMVKTKELKLLNSLVVVVSTVDMTNVTLH